MFPAASTPAAATSHSNSVGKPMARPARESVRLEIADMRDWSRAIDRPHAFERHRAPLPVALLPIERSPPAFAIDDLPAVGKPQRVSSIAAVFDECEPFRIGDEAVGETERTNQFAMARASLSHAKPSPP